MSLLRTFIALDIHPAILQSIRQKTESLRKTIGDCVRWVAEDTIHLTLKFLGDVPSSSLDLLTQMLRAEADSCPAFDMTVGGLGSFPNSKRPRVLFIGIQAPAELEALRRGIESAAARLGYESEARPFSPHLTLGRVRQNATLAEQQRIRKALDETRIDAIGAVRIDSVHLYKSELKPAGAVYTKLFSAPLRSVVASEAKQSPR